MLFLHLRCSFICVKLSVINCESSLLTVINVYLLTGGSSMPVVMYPIKLSFYLLSLDKAIFCSFPNCLILIFHLYVFLFDGTTKQIIPIYMQEFFLRQVDLCSCMIIRTSIASHKFFEKRYAEGLLYEYSHKVCFPKQSRVLMSATIPTVCLSVR